MRNRKLALRRESVVELNPDQLGRLAGGSAGTCRTCVVDCVTPLLVPEIAATRNCFTHHSAVDCLSDELCQR